MKFTKADWILLKWFIFFLVPVVLIGKLLGIDKMMERRAAAAGWK